jgi:formylglycine-generating enzyme required for sulfatase activity
VLLDLIARHDRPFTQESKLQDLYEDAIHDMLVRGNPNIRATRRAFANELAWLIQNSESGAMPAAEVQALASRHNAEFADLVRSRSLLVRVGNDYAFSHPSFREYLVAKQVGRELKPCKLTDTTIGFLRDLFKDEWKHEVITDEEKHPGMVKIPAGRFIYGAGDKPGHACVKEINKDFWIDRFPVTNRDFLAFLSKTGRKDHEEWIDHDRSRIKAGLELEAAAYADHPIVGVTWHGAKAYAEFAGKQLPTEEQWEKAARGVDGREYPWGDGFVEGQANVMIGDKRIGTTPVNAFKKWPSPYGCIDMAGNVWEWTATGEGEIKVLRGGSWIDLSVSARCASRLRIDPDDTFIDIGFRCART